MNPSLSDFKRQYCEHLLNFVWRQWSALGVAGNISGGDSWIIDPEALLLLTCTLGRHDARVFDEVLDWLQINGRRLNIQRLKRILTKEGFAGGRVLAALAGWLAKGTEVTKWKQLAEPPEPTADLEPLFSLGDGRPSPAIGAPDPHFARYGFRRGPPRLRGYSQPFRPTERANLVLQLRALIGVNSRCETLLYLLTHESAHPSEISREAYYFERAVQTTLVDMSQSGIVHLRVDLSKREKRYWIKPDPWWALLNRIEPYPRWVTWPPLFRALERIWLKLEEPGLLSLDPPMQSSVLRQLMVEVRPAIERAGFAAALSDDRQHLAEAYLPVFLSDIAKLLGRL